MTDEEVPRIGPELTPPIQLIVNNQGAECHHRSYVVEARERKVTCSTCGALIDPFDALLHLSRERHNEALNRKYKMDEISELHRRHEIFKTLVQRLKGEARRLGVPLSLLGHWDTKKLAEVTGIDKELLDRGRVIDADWAKRRKVRTQKPKLVRG